MRATAEPEEGTGPAWHGGIAHAARIYDYLLGGRSL
jgi:hypothetical protein